MAPAATATATAASGGKSDDEDNYEEYIPISKRRAMEAERLYHQRLSKPAAPSASGAGSPGSLPPPPPLPANHPAAAAAPDAAAAAAPDAAAAKPSLLVTSTQLKRAAPEVTATEQIFMQEKEMIENLSDRKTLMSVRELANGITYTEPLRTGWKPPLRLRRMPRAKADEMRRKWHILVDGDEIPPPARDFRDLRFPEPILRMLRIVPDHPVNHHRVRRLPLSARAISVSNRFRSGTTGDSRLRNC